MTDRGIILRAHEVRAVLDGRKTQHRVPIKGVDGKNWIAIGGRYGAHVCDEKALVKSPFGAPGAGLYVRETWCLTRVVDSTDSKSLGKSTIRYRADIDSSWHRQCAKSVSWRPSTNMRKEHARTFLRVKRAWVERARDINMDTAIAEGATRRGEGSGGGWRMDWSKLGALSRFAGGIHPRGQGQPLTVRDIRLGSPQMAWAADWDARYATKGLGFVADPWLFACEFERIEKP